MELSDCRCPTYSEDAPTPEVPPISADAPPISETPNTLDINTMTTKSDTTL